MIRYSDISDQLTARDIIGGVELDGELNDEYMVDFPIVVIGGGKNEFADTASTTEDDLAELFYVEEDCVCCGGDDVGDDNNGFFADDGDDFDNLMEIGAPETIDNFMI